MRALIGCLALIACTTAAGSSAARPASTDRWGTVWLCRPGVTPDPCTSDLATSIVGPSGATLRVQRALPATNPPVDCFYVYPTVSRQQTTNANLQIDPEQRSVAIEQASRFSTACRVYAPMYPQLTLKAIFAPGGITPQAAAIAYGGVIAAFDDYLAHYNRGRGIVFIGHSQGAALLIALLRREVDPKPALRRRMVSALLLGGNVTVARGKRTGGDFAHIPSCATATETGCVIAYSSFDGTPPAHSKFGRVGGGLSPMTTGNPATLQIMCVNPAGLSGARGALQPYFTSAFVATQRARPTPLPLASTPWVSYPGEYTARCASSGGATWLQVSHDRAAADRRPVVTPIPDATWGLHIDDVNLALGNLVGLVRGEARAFRG
ncbi:MAG TPA: DUF3089 domain-containing protein [Solirubrobacteraceae bacterium]|nr:DUF3089 domain-containing protein [Solirubrobacteraceae bacterium]